SRRTPARSPPPQQRHAARAAWAFQPGCPLRQRPPCQPPFEGMLTQQLTLPLREGRKIRSKAENFSGRGSSCGRDDPSPKFANANFDPPSRGGLVVYTEATRLNCSCRAFGSRARKSSSRSRFIPAADGSSHKF